MTYRNSGNAAGTTDFLINGRQFGRLSAAERLAELELRKARRQAGAPIREYKKRPIPVRLPVTPAPASTPAEPAAPLAAALRALGTDHLLGSPPLLNATR